jgi:hypothetical protein
LERSCRASGLHGLTAKAEVRSFNEGSFTTEYPANGSFFRPQSFAETGASQPR